MIDSRLNTCMLTVAGRAWHYCGGPSYAQAPWPGMAAKSS